MQQLKQSESTDARRRIPVVLVDATDGYTEETGVTPSSILVSKNGGTEASSSGTFAEVGHGHYYYEFTATELNTVGYVEVRVVSAAARTFYGVAQVVAFDPYDAAGLGLSRVDAAVSTLATAAALTSAAGDITTLIGRLTSTRAGYLDNLSGGAVALNADAATLLTRLSALRAGYLDNLSAGAVALASALSTAQSSLTAINADTDDIQSRLPAALIGGRLDVTVGAMQAGVVTAAAVATGAIDADALAADAGIEIAAAVAAPSASTIATAVAAALETDHGAGSWQTGSGGASADAIADAVLDELVAGHATSGSVGAALTTLLSGVAALPSASAIAAAVLAATLEGAHTVAGGLRMLLAVAAGRRTVSGTTHTFRDLGNTKSRVVATVDSSGNRSVASTADGT